MNRIIYLKDQYKTSDNVEPFYTHINDQEISKYFIKIKVYYQEDF